MSVAQLEQDQRQSLLKLIIIIIIKKNVVLLIIAFSLCKTIASSWKCKGKKNIFKEFVLVLGASSTESTNIVQTTYNYSNKNTNNEENRQ